MLVVMRSHASEEEVRAVCQRIESLGLKAHPIPGRFGPRLGLREQGRGGFGRVGITAGRGGVHSGQQTLPN